MDLSISFVIHISQGYLFLYSSNTSYKDKNKLSYSFSFFCCGDWVEASFLKIMQQGSSIIPNQNQNYTSNSYLRWKWGPWKWPKVLLCFVELWNSRSIANGCEEVPTKKHCVRTLGWCPWHRRKFTTIVPSGYNKINMDLSRRHKVQDKSPWSRFQIKGSTQSANSWWTILGERGLRGYGDQGK